MFLPLLFFTRVDVLDTALLGREAAVGTDVLLVGFLRVLAVADVFHHLAQADELIADDLIVLIQSGLEDVALGQLQVTDALGLGGEDGAGHRAQALAQVIQTSADGQAVLRESGLAAAVDDLQEQLTHSNVDGVADEVGVQRLEDGLAGQDLASHSGGVGHAGAANGLDQGFLDDAVFDVQA